MDEASSINAIAAPAPSVLTPGARFLGVLTLDTRFPRLVGDIGNPASFRVPTMTRVVRHARPEHVVQSAQAQRGANLVLPFQAALRELVAEGAVAITTSCGFLVLMQAQLQAACPVPVVTSSLLMVPALLGRHAQVGVLTISSRHLDEAYLDAAGVPPSRLPDVLVEGVDPEGAFARAMLGNQPTFDATATERDVVAAAVQLKVRAPNLTELVLECTNMPPYARAIERATGLRIWSLLECPTLLAPFQ